MRTSELIKLRKEITTTLTDLIDKVDRTIDTLQKSEGISTMFEGMTTNDKMDYVFDEICTYGGVTMDDIRLSRGGRMSGRTIKWAKIACYILTDYLHVSQWDIQQRLNYMNHNSVIKHRDTIRGFMESPDKFNDIAASTKDILKNLGL